MRRTFLAINLILIATLLAANALAQQATDSKENGANAALARAKQLIGLLNSNSIEPGAVRFHDRCIVPISRMLEGFVTPPVGKNIILVGEKSRA